MTQLAAHRYPGRPFAPDSFWNTKIGPDHPFHTDKTPIANSAGYVNRLNLMIDRDVPYINGGTNPGMPIYVAEADTPTSEVVMRGYTPYPPGSHPLQEFFQAVPIPPDATIEGTGDSPMVVWQPSTDKYWEFWTMAGFAGKWSCGYGGYMGPDNDFLPDDAFGVSEWPGMINWAGASGSGFPYLGGIMRAFELKQGVIPHPLVASIGEFDAAGTFIDNGAREGKIAYPATRSDGASTHVDAPPEGICFTLPDDYDPSGLTYNMARMMATAIRDYGVYIHDGAGAAIVFSVESWRSIGRNPYFPGVSAFFQNKSPTVLLADFPWDQLIALDTTIEDYP